MNYLSVIILVIGVVACQQFNEEKTMPPSIQKVKEQHEDRLLSMSGVVSIGIGRDTEGNPVIIVGLDRPRPETVEKIPKELEGYPVRVDIIGPVKAQ